MNEQPLLGIIINPNANKNHGHESHAGQLRQLVGDNAIVETTHDISDIDKALKRFTAQDVKTIVVDGGDGAMHWVINKAVDMYGLGYVCDQLSFLPSTGGTIDFIANALGLRGTPTSIIKAALASVRHQSMTETPLKSLLIELKNKNGSTEQRYAYGAAIAGYAANFYGPFYRSRTLRGPLRIIGLLGYGFGTGALGKLFRGPARDLKPTFIEKAEYDYQRSLIGEVSIDGQPMPGGGESGREYNLLQCGSVRIDLAHIIKVFHAADATSFHAQVGHLNIRELFPEVLRAALGKDIRNRAVHDGPTTTLHITCDPPRTMTPCLDGELFSDIVEVTVTPGPAFRFQVPHL